MALLCQLTMSWLALHRVKRDNGALNSELRINWDPHNGSCSVAEVLGVYLFCSAVFCELRMWMLTCMLRNSLFF